VTFDRCIFWICFVVIECNMDALMLPDNYAYKPEESRFDDVSSFRIKVVFTKDDVNVSIVSVLTMVIQQNRWRTVVRGTWKYMTLGWKCHTRAAPSWHFQPRVHIFPCPTHCRLLSVKCVYIVLHEVCDIKFFLPENEKTNDKYMPSTQQCCTAGLPVASPSATRHPGYRARPSHRQQ